MPPRRYNDFHQLHTTISKAGELGAEALAAAAFPEKQWFKAMLSTKDLAVRPNHRAALKDRFYTLNLHSVAAMGDRRSARSS